MRYAPPHGLRGVHAGGAGRVPARPPLPATVGGANIAVGETGGAGAGRVPRRRAAAPDAGLREPVPPDDGRRLALADGSRPPPHAPAATVPDRVRRVPIPDGVPAAGAGMVRRADLLPVGRGGAGRRPGGAV